MYEMKGLMTMTKPRSINTFVPNNYLFGKPFDPLKKKKKNKKKEYI